MSAEIANGKARLVWLDIAKGITILCTLIGHTVTGRIKGMIYSFHMPLFFLLAGYTFRKVPASEMKTEIKKDIFRLLFPYILLGCFKMIVDVIFYHQQIGKTIVEYLFAYLYGKNGKVGLIWFLIALFWARIVYRFVLLYIKEYRQMFILMLAFVGIWLGEIIKLPQWLDAVFPHLIFMEAGYLMKNHEQNMKQEIWQGIGIASFFAWTIYLHFSRGGVKLSLLGRHHDKYTLGILMAILASTCIIQFCRSIEAYKMVSGLAWLGHHSLAFLCVHDLDTKFETVKNLWDAESKTVVFVQGWLEEILSHYDKMQMYDSWNHVLTNGVVVCQRILLDVAVLFLFVQVRNLVHKAKKNM